MDQHIDPPEDGEDDGLVVPFVVTQDMGGPYDLEAFAAGCAYGEIRALLAQQPESFETCVESDLVPQLDLLAMELGYTLTKEPWGPDRTFIALEAVALSDGGAETDG